MLELVTGLRERTRERVRRVAGHPAEDLGRRGDRPEPRGGARLARTRRARAGERVADGGSGDERADEMAAAALVLARRLLAVLVRANRDVLGAVIGGELGAAQCQHRGRERKKTGQQLLRYRAQPARLADPAHGGRGADHRAEDAAALDRQLRRRHAALHQRQERKRFGEPGRAAQHRVLDARGAEALALGHDLEPPVGVPDRAGPRGRAVHEHTVREGHAAEPDLLLFHQRSVALVSPRSPPPGAPPGAPALPRRARRRPRTHRRGRRRASPRAPRS